MEIHAAGIDYNGLAILITAITGLIVGVGTVVLQTISLMRQSVNSNKLDNIHDCLHEQTTELKKTIVENTGK